MAGRASVLSIPRSSVLDEQQQEQVEQGRCPYCEDSGKLKQVTSNEHFRSFCCNGCQKIFMLKPKGAGHV